MKVTIIPIVVGALGTVTKGLVQGLGNNRTSGDHPNYCIIEISQNTEKSPGDLRKLVVTQTPVRKHQLILVWKTLKREQMIKIIIKIIIIKYTDLARELRVVEHEGDSDTNIVIGMLGTVPKGLLKELEELEIRRQIKTIVTTALLRLARILRRVLETWGDLQSLRLHWYEKLARSLKIIIIDWRTWK